MRMCVGHALILEAVAFVVFSVLLLAVENPGVFGPLL